MPASPSTSRSSRSPPIRSGRAASATSTSRSPDASSAKRSWSPTPRSSRRSGGSGAKPPSSPNPAARQRSPRSSAAPTAPRRTNASASSSAAPTPISRLLRRSFDAALAPDRGPGLGAVADLALQSAAFDETRCGVSGFPHGVFVRSGRRLVARRSGLLILCGAALLVAAPDRDAPRFWRRAHDIRALGAQIVPDSDLRLVARRSGLLILCGAALLVAAPDRDAPRFWRRAHDIRALGAQIVPD